MNSFLANTFKEHCNERLKELINSCYLLIDYPHKRLRKKSNSISVCEIYTPLNIYQELSFYKEELDLIADILNIEFLYIIPIDTKNLLDLKYKASRENDIEIWRLYLELQCLF